MRWAEEKKFDTSDYAALLKNPKVTEFMIQQIEPYQKDLAGFETHQAPHAASASFLNRKRGSHQHDEKVRRAVVARNYAAVINAMYAGTE